MVGTITLWSTENRIIGACGEKVDSREHYVTTTPSHRMNAATDPPGPLPRLRAELRESLLRLHGPLLGGEALASALGHRSAESLRQARRRGQVAVPLFTVPNRRGWYALTQDVADWLTATRARALDEQGGATPSN